MENKNLFNMNNYSKKTLEKEKAQRKANAEYLANYDKNLKESIEAEEKKKMEDAMSAARFGYSSTYTRSKNRVLSLQEEIEYQNNSTTIAMTEMVTEVVCDALLLDEEEFVKLNPNYKSEIRETVRGFLENAEINENINNADTLKLVEYVSRTLPNTKEGKYLTEEDIYSIIEKKKSIDVDGAIKSLSGNVSSRVATLVEKEQKRVDEIEKDIEKVAPKKEKVAAETTEVVEEVPAEEEIAAKEVPTEEVVEEMPEETTQEEIPAEGELTTVENDPHKKIKINSDGSVSIDVFHESFVHETPRTGLIESLAVNEAQNLLAEGKEYNGDLCIANAIMYVTILEAMNEMDLLNVTERSYANIIAQAGGVLNKENTKSTVMTENFKANASAFKNKTTLNETVISSQSAPILNRRNSDDIAERIRQRRLAQNQNNNLLD